MERTGRAWVGGAHSCAIRCVNTKALVAWQMALQSGNLLQPNWMNDPRFLLKRWPAIEATVRRLYAAAEV